MVSDRITKENTMSESADKSEPIKAAMTKAHEAWATCRTAHIRNPTPETASALDGAYDDMYDAEDAWKGHQKIK
ncbi:hypothetical protein SIID45300_01263 [Candidatus Magnetaquicoccaceae bacterium FCR-1]|uniref:Uncharacterized protein n=1 Tax=Candidatus Magnetaquiglobus chichijimensis TaxID=3141448 RepID=A0ABQ0C7T2_9PROT